MLTQLLIEIRAGGTLETSRLAARLDASPQLVKAMLEHLQRSGLIQEYVNCGEACQGCSLSAACRKSDHRAIRLWQSQE
ncbi:MAG: FeoC-like transcriptional regulator [Chloroflexota bacterium]